MQWPSESHESLKDIEYIRVVLEVFIGTLPVGNGRHCLAFSSSQDWCTIESSSGIVSTTYRNIPEEQTISHHLSNITCDETECTSVCGEFLWSALVALTADQGGVRAILHRFHDGFQTTFFSDQISTITSLLKLHFNNYYMYDTILASDRSCWGYFLKTTFTRWQLVKRIPRGRSLCSCLRTFIRKSLLVWFKY
jgi:hypothetical protein